MTDTEQQPEPRHRVCKICNRLQTPHYVKPFDKYGVCDSKTCQKLAADYRHMLGENND